MQIENYKKYLKYKNKYLEFKNQIGGYIEYIKIDDFELKYITVSSISELYKISKFNRINFIRNVRESVEDPTKVLFYFGHYDDDLSNYKRILNNFNGHIIYFYDFLNKWYENLLEPFKQYIIDNYSDIENYTFMGPSMGGYASLYMSLQFPDKKCICIALGPQTIQLDKKIYLHNNLEYYEEDKGYNMKLKLPLIHQTNIKKDITDLLKENTTTNTKIYIINSKFECLPDCFDNEIFHQQFIFLDNLHVGAIINFSNVKLILYNSNDHAIGSNINLKDIFAFINSSDNFNLLFFDQELGVQILKDNINEFIKSVPPTPISSTTPKLPMTDGTFNVSPVPTQMQSNRRTVSFSEEPMSYPIASKPEQTVSRIFPKLPK